MRQSRLILLGLFACTAVAAPVGTIQPADGSISTVGATTTVSLNRNSQINWSSLSLAAGEQLQVLSTGGGAYASLNLVTGGRSTILGAITADGPFYLVNPAGIFVGASGSIHAPQVLLSTLTPSDPVAALNGGTTSWSTAGLGTVQIEGAISAATSIVILSETISINRNASVATTDAAVGRIDMVAASSGVTGAGGNWSVLDPSRGQTGTLSNTGRIQAHSVQLISHGSLVNGGVITTGGATTPRGDQVLLRAVDIVNEESGIITARDIRFEGDLTPTQLGKLIDPDDGSNPGATTSTAQIPRLSGGAPQVVTQINPGQLGFTTLQSVQLAAPKPTATAAESTLAVRRGANRDTVEKSKRGKVKRTSFFGQVK